MCIGKGKVHASYEFGVKVSIATSLEERQFALHAKALPGNLYNGHTLVEINPDMENTIGNGIECILADASGQKRRLTPTIRPVRFDRNNNSYFPTQSSNNRRAAQLV